MFSQIPQDRYGDIKKKGSCPFPIINGVMDGLQEGDIYSNGANTELIVHKSGFSWVNDAGKDEEELVEFFINSPELPVYAHIYDARPELIEAFSNKNGIFNIKVRERVQLQYDGDPGNNDLRTAGSNLLHDGYVLGRITRENFGSLSVFGLDLGSRYWKGEEDFLKNGYGFCVFASGGTPACICYTASLAGGVAEVDVATREEFRNKGLARTTVRAFVDHALDHGFLPDWDCFTENSASLNTAKSLGFKETRKYVFLSIYNKSRKNEKG